MAVEQNIYQMRRRGGYLVCITWCNQVYSKSFSVSALGNPAAALAAAVAWRNTVSAAIGKPINDRTARPDGAGPTPTIKRATEDGVHYYVVVARGRVIAKFAWDELDRGVSAYLLARGSLNRAIARGYEAVR